MIIYRFNIIFLLRKRADKHLSEEEEEWEHFPTFEEAAFMAAGIPASTESLGKTQLDGFEMVIDSDVLLPHHLPRPVHVPTAPPLPAEPLYSPQNGKPIGTPLL